MHFFVWYYLTAWREALKGWQNFLRFWWYFFSVPWLLRTLIAPWHRDISPYGRGFDLRRFSQALANNLIARAVGFGMRLGAIVVWLFAEALTLVGGVGFVLAWPTLPFLTIFLLFAAVRSLRTQSLVSGLAAVGAPLAFWTLVLRGFRHRRVLALRRASPDELAAEVPRLWQQILRRLGYEHDLASFGTERSEFLRSQNLTEEDFVTVLRYEVERVVRREERHRFWDAENLFALPPLGRSWAFGYTVSLDRIGHELRPALPDSHQEFFEYARELKAMETILARTREANVLVVGEPGVGRERVLALFARELAAGRLANVISHKRLVQLNPDAVGPGAAFAHVMAEAAAAGNVILVLPGLEHYLKFGESLVPYLRSPAIQVIAVTSYAVLHEVLERTPEVVSHFEKVEVQEPDAPTTTHILLDLLASFEAQSGVWVPYPALKAIVERAERYIQDTPFPKKAIDLLDRAMTAAAERGEPRVTTDLVDAVVSEKTEIPVGRPAEEEKELLLHLETRLHERLVNQEEAVRQIADALRRARADIQAQNRPAGTFLFLGPTGVGKTETAKALARLYYGQERAMVRLDMSEFQEAGSVGRFIGDIPTHTPGVLTTAIRENPASLVLLDEIEKAHPNILHLFLQVLDDARLTDAWGRTVKFTSAFLIATSNAGSELIREAVRDGKDPGALRSELLETLQTQGVFRPEFLNRFDGVVIFRPLTEAELEKIALLLLGDLAERLREQQITFVPTSELAHEVSREGYHPEFGARPMRRVIQDRIEAALAKKILAGTLEKGATIAPRSFADV